MATAMISARIDEADNKDFTELCARAGLSVSSAINLFVKAVLKEKRIPFLMEQTSDPFYSPENQAYVLKSVRELRAGKGKLHELIEADDD